jgi:thiol-disulfide isomerase/thioredoxin
MATNPASMNGFLKAHKAVVTFFTSQTCPPCRIIEPVFERLAEEKTKGGVDVVFVKVDMGVGMGSSVAGEWRVRVTPSFIFFMDGKKVRVLQNISYHILIRRDRYTN